MKIAIIHNNNNNYGGIENQILSLCESFHGKGNFHFIYITEFQYAKTSEKIRELGVEICRISGSLYSQLKQIKQYVKEYNIDIIQTHTFDNSVKYRLIRLFCPHVKFVVRTHTYIACSWISHFKKNIYYLIDGLSSILVNKYIVNGNYLKNEMIFNTIINKKKIVSVIDGIHPLKTEYNPLIYLDHQNPKMIMLANLIRHKGHDTLIKSFRLLKEEGIVAYCDIFGALDRDVCYYEELKEMINQLGLTDQIHFKGFISDIGNELIKYPLVILPSDSEGTPNCIMEGMSVARVILVSDTGGIREMIREGEEGFLHKPCDAESLADAIMHICNTEDKELQNIANRGYEKWKKDLCINSMSDKFKQIYSTI